MVNYKMTKRYWNEDVETMNREDMRTLQSERLVKQVKHVYDNVPYYRELMEKKGLTPDDIKGIEDLHKLPFLIIHRPFYDDRSLLLIEIRPFQSAYLTSPHSCHQLHIK